MCKLDHSDEATIPKFLCRTCNPRETLPPVIDTPSIIDDPKFAKKRAKRAMRKLRAEERRLSNLIDDIGGRDPVAKKKLYAAIREVELQIEKAAA